MSAIAEMELLDEVVERLLEAGLTPRVDAQGRSAGDPDALIRLKVADRELSLPVEIKRSVSAATAGAVQARLAHLGREDALLVTDHVTPSAAERFKDLGQHFADTAGNMYISAPGVLIWVAGRRPDESHRRAQRSSRAFRSSGLRIMLCLLADPALADQTYRAIADAADVSLGSVQAVMKDLVGLGHLAERKHRRQLVERDRLLDTWSEFYAEMLRPKLQIARFRAARSEWWRVATPRDNAALWGGETAGALLTDHLRPEITTLYADALPKEFVIKERLRRDAEGDVEIRRRFWRRDLPSPRLDVVPVPLVYADLLAVGDSRCAETAEIVRAQYLV
jgi:Uncharacterized protein conserved in bacteria